MPSHRKGRRPVEQDDRLANRLAAADLGGAGAAGARCRRLQDEARRDVSDFRPSEPILFWLIVFSFGAKIAGYVIAGIKIRRNFFLYLKNVLTWVIVATIATGALWLAIEIMDYLSTLLPAKRASS